MNSTNRTLLALALTVAMSSANATTWEGYIMETTDDFDGITTYRTSSEMWPMDSGYVALEVMCSKATGMQLGLRLQDISFYSANSVELRVDNNAVANFPRSKTNLHNGWTKIHLNNPSSGSTSQLINQLRAGNTVAMRVSGSNGKMSSKIRLDGFTSVTNNIRQRCGIVAKTACTASQTPISVSGKLSHRSTENGQSVYFIDADRPVCVENFYYAQCSASTILSGLASITMAG